MKEILVNISPDEILKLISGIREGILTDKNVQNKLYYARKKKDHLKIAHLIIAREFSKFYE